ncbi:MAG: Fe-S cluster assembly protein SufD [Halobacteria archaeon]|nr:Fe-S cluster assembly protein SufD [Halobacteria archaeon]
MKTNPDIKEHYRDGVMAIQPYLAGHDLSWILKNRDMAIDALKDLPFPDRKQEDWRYTSPNALLEHCFHPVTDTFDALQDLDIDELLLQGLDAHRLVFANGRFNPALSDVQGLPRGITVTSLRQAIRDRSDQLALWLGKLSKNGRDAFTAMNGAEMNDGLFIHVPDGQTVDRPIEVLFVTVGMNEAIVVQPRNLIVLGQGARATLIERYASTGASLYFNNGISEVVLEQGADLQHYRLQTESGNAYHLHTNFVAQAADSAYTSTGYSLGGCWSRSDTELRFTAEGARAELAGLFTVGDRQVNDMRLNIDHAVPGCSSESNFRGLLHGRGRGVFDGRIVVARDAQDTEAHLNNANLLLTRNAEIDTKPQLEIYADNVKCSHGTTVGQLEEAQLFYLRSRGIAADEAQRMLSLGFAGEILDRCSIGPLRAVIEAEVSSSLATVAPATQSSVHGG